MSLGGGDGDGSGGGLLLFPAENEVQGERDDDERERAACLRWLLRFFPPSARPPVLLPSFSLSKFQVDFKWRTSLHKAPKINHRHASMGKKGFSDGLSVFYKWQWYHQTITLFEPAALQW